MGTWNTKIDGNDSFLDIYQAYFHLYNEGQEPTDISKKIEQDFAAMFNDDDDRHHCLFGLALAQWETKALDEKVFHVVKEIIDSGKDLELWKQSGADEKALKQRKAVLEKFLAQLGTEKDKPKRRTRTKLDFTENQLIEITAPDGKKTFTVSEHFTNGVYQLTASLLASEMGGGSVLQFSGQGKSISAKWLDSHTLEVTHDKDIVFMKKDESFYFFGDGGKVIYVPA